MIACVPAVSLHLRHMKWRLQIAVVKLEDSLRQDSSVQLSLLLYKLSKINSAYAVIFVFMGDKNVDI